MAMFDKLKEKAGEVAGAALETGNQAVHDFNEAVPRLKALGLSVHNLRVDIGVIPDVGVTLTGSVAAIDPVKIKEMIEAHQKNKVLVMILEGLRTASAFKEPLGDVGFKGVDLDVKLVPPKVSVRFTKTSAEPNV